MKHAIALFLLAVLLLSCMNACLPASTDGADSGLGSPTKEDGPTLTERVTAPAVHTSLAAADYYQYKTLSGNQKTAYERLCASIAEGKNNVDVSDLNIPREQANHITQKVTADNPQFFYLSKTISYTYDPNTDFLFSYQLLYTDGTTVDQYDGDKLTKTADRGIIDGQIRQFNAKINEVVSAIPPSLSAAEKEKKIHDYIVANTVYDTAAAQLIGAAEPLPRAYDAYGALCTGSATCEGYAKLFQYLCYCVGIPCTQVVGTADGGPHMWNALQLEGDWYLTDITWNDPKGNDSNLPMYDYYNITAAEMGKNHVADASVLSVPAATTDKLTFRKVYAMNPSGNSIPANYQTVLDRLGAEKEEYLMVYIKDISGDVQDYLSEFFFKEVSPLLAYISAKGYDISFDTSYFVAGNYAYLKLK